MLWELVPRCSMLTKTMVPISSQPLIPAGASVAQTDSEILMDNQAPSPSHVPSILSSAVQSPFPVTSTLTHLCSGTHRAEACQPC